MLGSIRTAVYLLFCCGVTFADETHKPDLRRIEVSAEELAKIPVWGSVVTSNPQNIEYDLGKRFLGHRFHGLIKVTNDTDSIIAFGEFKTGCGCTAAKPVDRTVYPGKTEAVIFRVRRTDEGAFMIDSTLTWDDSEMSVRLKGEIVPPITIDPLNFSKNGIAETRCTVHDPSIKSFNLKTLTDSYDVKFKGERLVVSCSNPNLFTSHVIFVPTIGKTELVPIAVPCTREGRVRVVPATIVGTKPERRFFLMGDVPLETGTRKAIVEIGDRRTEHAADVSENGSAVIVTLKGLEVPSGSHTAKVTVSEFQFQFQCLGDSK